MLCLEAAFSILGLMQFVKAGKKQQDLAVVFERFTFDQITKFVDLYTFQFDTRLCHCTEHHLGCIICGRYIYIPVYIYICEHFDQGRLNHIILKYEK